MFLFIALFVRIPFSALDISKKTKSRISSRKLFLEGKYKMTLKKFEGSEIIKCVTLNPIYSLIYKCHCEWYSYQLINGHLWL